MRKHYETIAAALLFYGLSVAILATVFSTHHASTHASTPSGGVVTTPVGACPTEDSCAVSYHDGQWHVTHDTP